MIRYLGPPAFKTEPREANTDSRNSEASVINPGTTTILVHAHAHAHAHDNLNFDHCSPASPSATGELASRDHTQNGVRFSFAGASPPNGSRSLQTQHQHSAACTTTNGDISINPHDVSRQQELLVPGSPPDS